MDERYVSALEENPNIIDEKLKRLTINSLRSVFYMLGEYGFLRWIDTKDIPDRLKKLVVDEFNAEDLFKYSYCSGYYSGSYRDGNETIKVKNKFQVLLSNINYGDEHGIQLQKMWGVDRK